MGCSSDTDIMKPCVLNNFYYRRAVDSNDKFNQFKREYKLEKKNP